MHKTAVSAPFELFQFLYMTFGLSNAPATFQKFIYRVMRGSDFCVPYFDDVLIASENDNQHFEYLKQVFQSFEKCRFRQNASKYVLGKSSVQFLNFWWYYSTITKGIGYHEFP
ncbi:hypothetical protein AVEN_29874-1 [Araneus ventricosus]|uniref:Reverse transcriptase domain-containing protein n=1 Tax=Araneus ventricosus TaxID=182803 RepID=A0A4Y2S6E2_ARAVE|nr:hypothetical protein AVEN_29874-1 [Araneus ventricosus]